MPKATAVAIVQIALARLLSTMLPPSQGILRPIGVLMSEPRAVPWVPCSIVARVYGGRVVPDLLLLPLHFGCHSGQFGVMLCQTGRELLRGDEGRIPALAPQTRTEIL